MPRFYTMQYYMNMHILMVMWLNLCLHQVEDFTETGQTLDLLTAPEDRIDFTQFTLERWLQYCSSYVVHSWLCVHIHVLSSTVMILKEALGNSIIIVMQGPLCLIALPTVITNGSKCNGYNQNVIDYYYHYLLY